MKSWLPWQFLLRVAARRRGFIDPIEFLARMRRFTQPSEVQEPIELVRAGVLFHARGLINTKVFQYNLDWIWPFWVVRQFDPGDASFLPRAFSFSHVNLTHRNWTAVGLPGMDAFPIVDPRGLVTLPDDPWSLDWWFLPEEGSASRVYPSRHAEAQQELALQDGLRVVTRVRHRDVDLETAAWVEPDAADSARSRLVLEAVVRTGTRGHLVLAARPANPEGVHFIEDVQFSPAGWTINGRYHVVLEQAPEAMVASTYAHGDLPHALGGAGAQAGAPGHVKCSAGMATVAAGFRVAAGNTRTVRAHVALDLPAPRPPAPSRLRRESWSEALSSVPRLEVPEPRWTFLFDAAVRTIVLLSPGDIYPGPSTYRRFWFRDACLVMNAMLAANLETRVAAAMQRFPLRQRQDGYFHSQEGEWDANGQVLWIADRFERCTGQRVPSAFVQPLMRGAEWIARKRRDLVGQSREHGGLLPPGFSAEHLGPVDQYYWDDFWGIAGLRAAAGLAHRHGHETGERWDREARAFADDVRASLAKLPPAVAARGVPASPHRRMDAGAIGSMVADYPLLLDDVVAPALSLRTADWLWRHCRYEGGFFQDMIHSGINAYLTLALAQTFLRHGDERHRGLIDAVARLASPTGQWPEAVHPRTLGGCMGDGQHTWAAAEWVLVMRALFLREEHDGLVLAPGIRPEWLEQGGRIAFGPTLTAWGPVEVALERVSDGWTLRVVGRWHGAAPRLRAAVPGFATEEMPESGVLTLARG